MRLTPRKSSFVTENILFRDFHSDFTAIKMWGKWLIELNQETILVIWKNVYPCMWYLRHKPITHYCMVIQKVIRIADGLGVIECIQQLNSNGSEVAFNPKSPRSEFFCKMPCNHLGLLRETFRGKVTSLTLPLFFFIPRGVLPYMTIADMCIWTGYEGI